MALKWQQRRVLTINSSIVVQCHPRRKYSIQWKNVNSESNPSQKRVCFSLVWYVLAISNIFRVATIFIGGHEIPTFFNKVINNIMNAIKLGRENLMDIFNRVTYRYASLQIAHTFFISSTGTSDHVHALDANTNIIDPSISLSLKNCSHYMRLQ